ncbi:MAG: XdhC family protein [Thermaceae bacterium]|nr:XdhC family protein [Thermaceae bacterium]
MDIYSKIAELKRKGESFAVATVVMRQAPVSSHLGDKALVFEDGRFEGYVGGACSREIVRKQALEAIQTGKSRLVKITPQVAALEVLSRSDEVVIPMTCASEGAVDVYIEPQLSQSALLIVGASKIALATAKLAAAIGYQVTLACEEDELAGASLEESLQAIPWKDLGSWLEGRNPSQTHILLASQGHYDEDPLALIAQAQPSPAYLGLVASRKRGATVLETLEVMGVPRAFLSNLKFPAGLDLGAKTPEDVAVSILAEMVALKYGKDAQSKGPRAEGQLLQPIALNVVQHTAVSTSEPGTRNPEPASATDPVCGMSVDIATARHSYQHQGTVYYFCCPHCKAKFQKDPAKYLSLNS